MLLILLSGPACVGAEDPAAPLSESISEPSPSQAISQAKAAQEIADHALSAQDLQLPGGTEAASPEQPDPTATPTPSPSPKTKAEKVFSVYFGSKLADPSGLLGSTRPPLVPAASNIQGGIDITVGGQYRPNQNLNLNLELRGGETSLGGDLGLFYSPFQNPRQGVAVNVFNQRSFSPAFDNGVREVNLPNDDRPWVHRLGGGIAWRQPFSPALDAAVGISYQTISVRNARFSSRVNSFDALGNRLTLGNDSIDSLLTLNLGVQYDTRDQKADPTKGTHLRFGFDQALPVGDAQINLSRLSASASQFIPVKFWGFAPGSRTVVLNLQGGHIFGVLPPYEAFSLGGTDTVRGYSRGDIGTGRSFIQASAEYRFPIANIKVRKRPFKLGGALFIDYGSTLNTQGQVIGTPGLARQKPGEGLGGGFGLRADTGFGIGRVDIGFSDRGDVQGHVTFGERF